MKISPNLFIIGAPKCGTTSLHNYLAQHPDVCMSSLKEPHYFAGDFSAPQFIKFEKQYRKLFLNPEKLIVGESSPLYLYSDKAIEKIFNFNPAAKILITIRNPAELILSMYDALVANGKEDAPSLEKALELELQRRKNIKVPKYCLPKESCYYTLLALYSSRILKWQKLFGEKNVKVVIMDDMKKNITEVFYEIEKFLNLTHCQQIDFSIGNEKKAVRSKMVQRAFILLPYGLKNILKKFLPKKLRILVFSLNTKAAKIEHDMKVELRSIRGLIIKEIDAIASIPGININADEWKKSIKNIETT